MLPGAEDLDDATYAQALIDREREDARAGLLVLGIFFGLGIVGSIGIELVLFRVRNVLAYPLVVILALVAFSIGRRVWRLGRAVRQMRQAWGAGNLGDGRNALEVARSRHAA